MRVWAVAALLAGASATTPASEVAALRDFYGALGGDGWLDSDGWNSARDPCCGSEPWYGITCETNTSSSNTTHVVGITLESNQLDGTLPASLANLPRLRTLDLESNQVAGTTPRGDLRAARARDVGRALQQHERHDPVVLGELHRAVGDRLHADLGSRAERDHSSLASDIAVIMLPVVLACFAMCSSPPGARRLRRALDRAREPRAAGAPELVIRPSDDPLVDPSPTATEPLIA